MNKSPSWLVPYLLTNSSIYLGYGPGSVPPQICWRTKRKIGWQKHFEWKENEPFFASLKFAPTKYEPGRVTMENTETGAKYSITMGNLKKMLQKSTVVFGVIVGKWKFQKNGDSYSLVFIP